jgi:mannose-6-phosphate isomerase-like protein (cupin superfamily)
MRISIIGVLALALMMTVAAQVPHTPLPAPGTVKALYLTAADVQTALSTYPEAGAAEMKSIDAGKHVVDFWFERRKPATTPAQSAIVHAEITELYYIVRGTATLMTSARIAQPAFNDSLEKTNFPGGGRFVTPTYGGKFEGGDVRRVGPGDVIVIPPGTSHQWTKVDSPDFAYFIARIDPEKRQASGVVNPALKP